MYLSCGVDIIVYDISSLIMEREGTERAMLGSVMGGSSPLGMLRCPCFLMWCSCESDLHNCVYDSHSTFGVLLLIPLILPRSLLLPFLFSIFSSKSNSSVVSLCHFQSIMRLFNFPLPWFLICLNGFSYGSLSNWTMYQALPEQSLFCLFVNWESDLSPLRQLTYAMKHLCRAGLLPSSEFPRPLPCLLSQFHRSSSNVPCSERPAPAALRSCSYLFIYLIY